MQSEKLQLTDAQLRRLAKGLAVTIKKDILGKGYDIYMSPAQHKKMMRSFKNSKGHRLKLCPEEMKMNEVEISGGRIDFRKIGRVLRSTAKSIGKAYREHVRPTLGPALKKLVIKGVEEGLPAATTAISTAVGQPEIGAMAEPFVKGFAKKISEPVAKAVSKTTGAFGVKGKGMKMRTRALAYTPKLQDNYSQFLNPNHPAQHPALPLPSYIKGEGLFLMRQGRGLFMGRGYAATEPVGSPMNPRLPYPDNSPDYF